VRPRRGLIWAGAALLVAAALTVAVGPGLLAGVASAEASECEWHPHKVRVVRHVKRHGRRVRVVRRRVRWTCVPVSNGAPVAPPGGGGAPGTTPPPVQPIDEGPLSDPHRLGAVAHEFYYVPTHTTLSAGEETIELVNEGQDAHNLNVERVGASGEPLLELPETGPHGEASGKVVLPPGEYRIYCSLPEHEEQGMHTTITVVP
jgi:plastocyanin